MGLNTNVIVVGILSLNVFAFLVILFSGNIPLLILSPSLKLVPPLHFFTNLSLPLFPHDTSSDPFTILLIFHANSPVSPLAPPLVVDLVLDQTSDLPLTAHLASPPVVDPILDQPSDLPFAAPPADSLVSPQEPTPPVDLVIDQTPPLPLLRSDQIRAPPTHLCNYSCFSVVLSLHEPHTYREACINPLWQQAMIEEL
jgi:hypothetical protein